MTVEQLIQELENFQKDTPVKVNCDGDSANPYCKIIQAVVLE